MARIAIDFPDEVLAAFRRSPEHFARELRLAAAMHWYQQGKLSQEMAASVAGLDRSDFLQALAREGIEVFAVDIDELAREMDLE